jgi:hypothetical protein
MTSPNPPVSVPPFEPVSVSPFNPGFAEATPAAFAAGAVAACLERAPSILEVRNFSPQVDWRTLGDEAASCFAAKVRFRLAGRTPNEDDAVLPLCVRLDLVHGARLEAVVDRSPERATVPHSIVRFSSAWRTLVNGKPSNATQAQLMQWLDSLLAAFGADAKHGSITPLSTCERVILAANAYRSVRGTLTHEATEHLDSQSRSVSFVLQQKSGATGVEVPTELLLEVHPFLLGISSAEDDDRIEPATVTVRIAAQGGPGGEPRFTVTVLEPLELLAEATMREIADVVAERIASKMKDALNATFHGRDDEPPIELPFRAFRVLICMNEAFTLSHNPWLKAAEALLVRAERLPVPRGAEYVSD